MINEKEREILRFLIDGKAYSDSAIMKNFGIDEEELKEVYATLLSQGYLETYESYETREKQKRESMNENHCGTGCSGCGGHDNHHGDNSCGSSCGTKASAEKKGEETEEIAETGCCGEQDIHKEKILVLTEKALRG